MNDQPLKWATWVCKIVAIVGNVCVPLILHPRWGLNRIADVQLVSLAVLSLIPNRWLVFSRISFVMFLLLTLFPFRIFLESSAYRKLRHAVSGRHDFCRLVFCAATSVARVKPDAPPERN